MGCVNTKVSQNKDRYKIYEPRYGLSSWYQACRDGDQLKLQEQLPFLTFDQLNRIEPNGSTCLHVACYEDHVIIVFMLLMCGCDRNIKNKYGLIPLQEAKSDKVRELFTADKETFRSLSKTLYTGLDDDMFAPNNKYILGHASINDVYDAKQMMKAYRKTGLQQYYAIHEITMQSYVTLRRIVTDCIPSTHHAYNDAIKCLDSENPFDLIRLYTFQTDFYTYLQGDNVDFTASIFINLAKFKNRAYQGRSYRGVKMAHFDVNAWKWATEKDDRIIEIQTFLSTSELEQIALSFGCDAPENRASVLFIFDFPSKCDTAIKLTKDESKGINEDMTEYPYEKEVLVTPYTLFKVNSIDFNQETNWYRIHLTNIPIV